MRSLDHHRRTRPVVADKEGVHVQGAAAAEASREVGVVARAERRVQIREWIDSLATGKIPLETSLKLDVCRHEIRVAEV